MKAKRRVFIGRWVYSNNDKDRHYVPSIRLPMLYGFKRQRDDCFIDTRTPEEEKYERQKLMGVDPSSYTVFEPKADYPKRSS